MTALKQAKPNRISKREVYNAWLKVKENGGTGGADGESIATFEAELSGNLYKLWNRMSSGSYFPSAVKRVEIPKKDGGIRPLGIPTIYDRVAQEVVRKRLEEVLEPLFHEDSYGYRVGKSAHDALSVCRRRNWEYDWVLEVDIKKFFDTVDHGLLLKAAEKHCPEKKKSLELRLAQCGLELHPEKTQTVYCKDSSRRAKHNRLSFTFLGYTFRPRAAQNKVSKGIFTSFLPAASKEAQRRFRLKLRALQVRNQTGKMVEELAEQMNPLLAGWFGYFGHFYPSALGALLSSIDRLLTKWARNKYRWSITRSVRWLERIKRQMPQLFAHWRYSSTQSLG